MAVEDNYKEDNDGYDDDDDDTRKTCCPTWAGGREDTDQVLLT